MKETINWFKQHYTPLQQLLIIGFFVRLFSVIFSKGFGWSDDHFLIIESSQSWVDGEYGMWLPSEKFPDRQPLGHSLFYIGIHFYIFKFLKLIGFADPQVKMYFIRLFHALWSLLIIKYAYKITEQYGNKKIAWYVGVFMALYWFMPFISVRNLVEFVCVPPVLMAIYLLAKDKLNAKNALIAGTLLGFAFSIRFQTIFISFGLGTVLLFTRTKIKYILLLTLSFFTIIFLTQGLVDLIIWKRPFAEFASYVEYNINNASNYGTDNWHMYFDLIFGLLIPPLSFLLFAGYFYTWKKIPLLFWPVLLYLAFHTYFPNKQERFVMTILPLMIISGTIGMFGLYEKYKAKINVKLFKFCKVFVIVLNLILLPVLTLSYSKRHRAESMSYLYHKDNSRGFIIEDSNKQDDFLMPPLYYYGKWFSVWGVSKTFNPDSVLKYYNATQPNQRPNYVIFYQAENFQSRLDSMKKRFPTLVYETTIDPSFIDKTLYFLNPLNDNQTAFIYRVE